MMDKKRLKRIFPTVLGLFLLAVACGRTTDHDAPSADITAGGEITPEGAGPEGELPSAGPYPEASATPAPIDGMPPPATKIDGEIYWTMYHGGQADRFKIKEENFLGEILYYVPRAEGGVSGDSPDYSSECYPPGVKVYRDEEDETKLWFVEYHEDDNYNEYSSGMWVEGAAELPPKGEK